MLDLVDHSEWEDGIIIKFSSNVTNLVTEANAR
jgi:hypothetical protein